MRQYLILAFLTPLIVGFPSYAADPILSSTMCRNERLGPRWPRGTIIDVSMWNHTYARGSTPAQREAKRDTLVEFNGSTADLPFRLFVIDKSQPVQVLYRIGDNYQNGPVLRPGVPMDIARPRFSVRNYCIAGSPCGTAPALQLRCKEDGSNRRRTVEYYFNSVGAMLLEGRDEYRRRDVEWRNNSPLFAEWYDDPIVPILDSVTPMTYFVWGRSAGNVLVDGEDTGPIQARPGRYYEGRRIEVRLNDPRARTSINYRFIRG